MIRLIDTHTHLEEIEDLGEAIGRAEKSGVLGIITVGSDYESNNRALEIFSLMPCPKEPATLSTWKS